MFNYKNIGLYEIVTGIFGILLLFMNIDQVREHKEYFNTFISGIALFGLSILAGYILWKGYKNAIRYSMLLQFLQSFAFIIRGYHYLFTGGAFASLLFSSNGAKFCSQISPINYQIAKVSPQLQTEIKIFLLPIIFLVILIIYHFRESKA
jgi:hypothetical protein